MIYSNLGGEGAAALDEAAIQLEAKKISGYLGLLSPYYFGGAGTTTTVLPADVNTWVDVNLTVDPAGTFDYRPADMVAADSTGFTGSGIASQSASQVTISGTINTASNTGDFTLSPLGSDVTIRFLFQASSGLYKAQLVESSLALLADSGYTIDFSGAGGSISSGPTTITDGTFTVDFSAVTTDASAALSIDSDNAVAGDPYLFTLCGLTQQSFGKMRVTGLYTPDIDEGQLDVRLLFTPNSSGQFGQFSIAEQAATMAQGAGEDYFVEPTITFFVGDTIEEIGTVEASDAGRLQLQIRSTVEGEFTLRGLTLYTHS